MMTLYLLNMYINYMNYKIIGLVVLVLCILLLFYLLNKSLMNSNEHFDNQDKIPKIIIQTWKSKDIPDKYKEDIDSLKKYNSDYEFLFFDEQKYKQNLYIKIVFFVIF